MRVKFYGFNKKVNSTARPTGSDWSPEVNLKSATSFYSPRLLVGVETGANVTRHNYLSIDNVCGVSTAYYYIDDWISVRNDLYEVACHMDLLATYKDYILATTAYVKYSQSAGNSMIPDNRVALNPVPDMVAVYQSLQPPTVTGGSYILYITGKDSTGFYALSKNALAGLLTQLSDWTANLFPGSYEDSFAGVSSAILDAIRQLVSSGGIASNISSCTFVPWQVPGESTPMWLGNFDTGRAGRLVDYTNTTAVTTLSLPSPTGTWLDGSGGTTANLYLPYCGNISIPANILIGRPIEVQTSVQMCTGDIAYSVSCNGYMIGTFTGCAGVSVPLGVASVSKTSQIAGMAVSDASLAASGLLDFSQSTLSGGNDFTAADYDAARGAVSGAANKIGQFVNDMGRSYHSIGGAGNGASAGLASNSYITLSAIRYKPISDPSIMGKPTMRTMTLSSLTGYVECAGAQVAAPTGKGQLNEINYHLNGGVWIE